MANFARVCEKVPAARNFDVGYFRSRRLRLRLPSCCALLLFTGELFHRKGAARSERSKLTGNVSMGILAFLFATLCYSNFNALDSSPLWNLVVLLQFSEF